MTSFTEPMMCTETRSRLTVAPCVSMTLHVLRPTVPTRIELRPIDIRFRGSSTAMLSGEPVNETTP